MNEDCSPLPLLLAIGLPAALVLSIGGVLILIVARLFYISRKRRQTRGCLLTGLAVFASWIVVIVLAAVVGD